MSKALAYVLTVLVATSALLQLNYAGKEELKDDLNCGLTLHFQQFLNQSGYGSWDFGRSDIACGSYGGKDSDDPIDHDPIIFIHGNSDIAFGRGSQDSKLPWQTGFRSLATYFHTRGYTKGELYTTTWGNGIDLNSSNVCHSKEFVMRMRKFVEAVLVYTGARQVVVIGHAMGVTIARKVIKGGLAVDRIAGAYEVGAPLTPYVKSFIGIAGANLGLPRCFASVLTACNNIDGFDPGTTMSTGPATFLKELNSDGVKEGTNVYTIWSEADEYIGHSTIVFTKYTCRIEDQDSEIKKQGLQWGHFALRDNTGPDLINWL